MPGWASPALGQAEHTQGLLPAPPGGGTRPWAAWPGGVGRLPALPAPSFPPSPPSRCFNHIFNSNLLLFDPLGVAAGRGGKYF